MMRVAQAVGWYFPESSGGSEVYVDALARHLVGWGVESVVASCKTGFSEERYPYNGIEVYRYPVHPQLNRSQIRGITPHGGFDSFVKWIKVSRAQIYHQHTVSTGCGLHHLRAAKAAGLPIVTTVHIPGLLCLRGTMIRGGSESCDGKILPGRCAACWADSLGAPPLVAGLLAQIPSWMGSTAERIIGDGKVKTAIGVRASVIRHQRYFKEIINLSDRVVAVCQWLYEALVLNGASQNKVVLCRQGVDDVGDGASQVAKPDRKESLLRLGFLGRLDPMKGIDFIVEALGRLPVEVPFELVIHGSAEDSAPIGYLEKLRRAIGRDARMRLAPPLPRERVREAMRSFDALLVPSQWFETGPLVILEAFCVGTPVIGSNLGGIAELVRHEENGWLLDWRDADVWAEAVRTLVGDRSITRRWRSRIGPVRTMGQVAGEMKNLYDGLVKHDSR